MIEEDESFISISDEEYAAMLAKTRQGNSLDFHGRYAKAHDWQSKHLVIRAAYEHYLPSIKEAAKTGHSVDPNIVTWDFLPIEDDTWLQIRALGLPLFPKFPVFDYFTDFADPLRKIIIELGGKKSLIKKKEDLRDKRVKAAGWKIYRLSGRAAMRYLESAFSVEIAREIEGVINGDDPFSEENKDYIKMAESTLDGYLLVLRRRYYTKD
ncbi:hypothetical protein GCM10027422_28720 [Hymenobacter arcticus]